MGPLWQWLLPRVQGLLSLQSVWSTRTSLLFVPLSLGGSCCGCRSAPKAEAILVLLVLKNS
ncbi:hypothetical protein I79_009120 [Cricetulus griseus]|uniref:Uncharacterized protein n=1 Tax=Cricetulus griseus TaxID=10029 RepID=G3HEX4_CRIGR|nr:hypothetical protein I79_009120 [Cricetulus griseus]